jgi:hypothetical protein
MTAVVDALGVQLPDPGPLREAYLAARPWPHLVLHDLFPPELVAAAERECRGLDPVDMHVIPTWRQVKREQSDGLGPATSAVLDVFDSPEWVAFLSEVTGIPGLVADPGHHIAGAHETPAGGFTMVHTDFTKNPHTGMHHRTNTLLYLNSDWREEYGGALELWPDDMSACGRRVVPTAGTVVLWETHNRTPHGLPDPVADPAGRSRVSIAAYHYTPPPPGGVPRPRFATYRRRPQDPWRTGLPTFYDVVCAVVPQPARSWVKRTLLR